MNIGRIAIDMVLRHEGGYVNNPADPGGETNMGISKRSYPNLDIKKLTRPQAILIYKQDYWDACRCDDLPPAIALSVMDYAVNSGTHQAVKDLQRVIGCKADGQIGPITLRYAENAYQQHESRVLIWYHNRRLQLVQKLDAYAAFGDIWRKRILETHGLAMQVHAYLHPMKFLP